MNKNMEDKIAEALAATKHDWALMMAQETMRQAAEKARQVAAEAGVPIYVKVSAGHDDGSRIWPTTLAGTLCERPSLAGGTRDDMANLLTVVMGMDRPFAASRLSKPLGTATKKHVSTLLDRYGYASSTLTNGLSIRNIVRDNIRSGTGANEFSSMINTKFFADRVEIDGIVYRYRQRDRVPTGHAWQDLALRLSVDASGANVPLLYLLKMRNIGLGEFINADAEARAIATSDELKARAVLDMASASNQRADKLIADSREISARTSNNVPSKESIEQN